MHKILLPMGRVVYFCLLAVAYLKSLQCVCVCVQLHMYQSIVSRHISCLWETTTLTPIIINANAELTILKQGMHYIVVFTWACRGGSRGVLWVLKHPPPLQPRQHTGFYRHNQLQHPPSTSIYQPISLLCIVSKVFEHLIFNKISKFITINNILCHHQFGFRQHHSTADLFK